MASNRKPVNLALQGGGALGAYTWGVLDALLEDDRIEIAAISGASAGAMNGAVLAQGLVDGGEAEARAALRRFWEGLARATQPGFNSPLSALMSAWAPPWSGHMINPFATWLDLWSRVASPYDLNPLNLNPVKDVLESLVNFDHVRACDSVRLYVSATNVETGRVRVFTNEEITADHVMASACLPLLFQTVMIDGEPYWDGGYMGNPPLFPLFEASSSRDIIVVQINPIERPGVPRSSRDIISRLNEITFNASLLREFRAIEFVARLLDEGRLDAVRYRKMLIHVISDDEALLPLGAGAGLNTNLAFFEKLFEIGRAACARWLEAHFDSLGEASTVDLRRMFDGEVGPMRTGRKGRKNASSDR